MGFIIILLIIITLKLLKCYFCRSVNMQKKEENVLTHLENQIWKCWSPAIEALTLKLSTDSRDIFLSRFVLFTSKAEQQKTRD